MEVVFLSLVYINFCRNAVNRKLRACNPIGHSTDGRSKVICVFAFSVILFLGVESQYAVINLSSFVRQLNFENGCSKGRKGY